MSLFNRDKRDKGQSMVEMALVLPLLLLLMFGIIEGGRLFSSYVELQNHARDGARFASIKSGELDTSAKIIDWRDDILIPRIEANLLLLDPANLNVALTKSSVGTTDEWMEVTLTYSLELVTPFIGDILATDQVNNTIDLTAKIAMRGE